MTNRTLAPRTADPADPAEEAEEAEGRAIADALTADQLSGDLYD